VWLIRYNSSVPDVFIGERGSDNGRDATDVGTQSSTKASARSHETVVRQTIAYIVRL